MEEKSEKIKDYLTEGRTYVQRDLEDQIEEEYKSKGRIYDRTDKKSPNMSTQQAPTVVVQDVLDLLKKGYTRLAKDSKGYGSIQEHYKLTGVQIKELFNHPKLRQRKTILPRTSLNIVDADNAVEEEIERLEAENSIPIEEEPQQDVVVTSPEFILKRDQLFS